MKLKILFFLISIITLPCFSMIKKNSFYSLSEKLAYEYFEKALFYYKSGDIFLAFKYYVKASDADKKILGFNDNGIVKNAITFFRKKLLKNPLDIESRYYFAKAKEINGDMKTALHEYKKLIKNFSNSIYAGLSWEQINRYLFINTLNLVR